MPGTYSDSLNWIIGPCYDNGAPTLADYCKFTTAGICPAADMSVGTDSSNGRGYVGGNTQSEALREFAAWSRIAAYDDQRLAWAGRGFIYCLYNYSSGECVPVNVASPLTPEEIARSKRMMNVKLFKESGKLFLTVDAAGLHETLDAIGCQTETTGTVTQYKDRPHTSVAVLDASSHTLSTELLLKKGVQRVDLSTVYPRPPTGENLKKLANSANDKCRQILEHYQPIDIQVTIQKKVLGAA